MSRAVAYPMAVVILILGGWYLLWARPMDARMAGWNDAIRTEELKLTAYRQALTRFNEHIEEYNRLHAIAEKTPPVFSAADEITALYQALDSLCHRPGYRLEEITPSLDEVIRFLRQWPHSDSTASIPIRLRVRAAYRPLAQILEMLEQSKYFQRVTFCRVSGSDELYPQCALDLAFRAGLNNRLEMFNLE